LAYIALSIVALQADLGSLLTVAIIILLDIKNPFYGEKGGVYYARLKNKSKEMFPLSR
jgi:glycerate kinase